MTSQSLQILEALFVVKSSGAASLEYFVCFLVLGSIETSLYKRFNYFEMETIELSVVSVFRILK